MPTELSIETSASGIEYPCLRVVFTYDRDRWTHEIQLVVDKSPVVVARNVRDDASVDWAASPVLQEMTEHKIQDQYALLGVGMAGANHWSISASVDEYQRLNFDVACLVKREPVGWLGSNYQIAKDVSIELASAGELLLAKHCWRINFQPLNQDTWGTRLDVRDGRLSAVPSCVTAAGSQSNRWGYAIKVEEKRR